MLGSVDVLIDCCAPTIQTAQTQGCGCGPSEVEIHFFLLASINAVQTALSQSHMPVEDTS